MVNKTKTKTRVNVNSEELINCSTELKDKAKREVIAGNIDEDVDYGSLWNSSFYINTFGNGYKANKSNKKTSNCGCGK